VSAGRPGQAAVSRAEEQTVTEPQDEQSGKTPSAPDVDQPEGGTGDARRTPDAADQAEGDDD
jgi:hypothetical protein